MKVRTLLVEMALKNWVNNLSVSSYMFDWTSGKLQQRMNDIRKDRSA